jgi:hypothetical protein
MKQDEVEPLAKKEKPGVGKVQYPLFSVGACWYNCKESITKTELSDHLNEIDKKANESNGSVKQTNVDQGQLSENDDIVAKLQVMPHKRSRNSAAAALAATDISLLNPNSDSDTSGDEATYTIMNQTGILHNNS